MLVLTAGCSWIGPSRTPDDNDRALEAAGELENAHRYAIARDQLEAVAALTEQPRATNIRMRACRTYELDGDAAAARRCFANAQRDLQTAPALKDPDAVSEARELEGRSALATADTPEALESVIVTYADTDAARRALIARMEDARDEGGCKAQVALIDRLEPRVTATLIRADLCVQRASLLLKDCRDPSGALVAARHAEEVSDATHFLDDARFVRAKAAEAMNASDEALKAYERIIATRSDAMIFGSNDSMFLDDAWMAHGLLLEKLGRTKEAIGSLEDLIDARPESRFHDDADRAIARMKATK